MKVNNNVMEDRRIITPVFLVFKEMVYLKEIMSKKYDRHWKLGGSSARIC